MTDMQWALAALAAHSAIGLICLAAAFVKRSTSMKLISLTILLTPPVGAIYFFGGFIARRVMKKQAGMQLDDISFSKTRHNRTVRPDVEIESQAVPLEEVLLVSADEVKRSHLLMQLKKDRIDNYEMIRKALDSDDPETSHYAASALTSAKANFENTIREMDSKYIKNSKDPALIRAYADYVVGFVHSGILDAAEEKKYSYIYINILTSVDNPEALLTDADYADIVDRAIFVGEFETAQRWAEAAYNLRITEASSLSMLKVYYYTGQQELFFGALDELKHSDIALSEEGLSLVRFFAAARQAEGRRGA